MYQKAFNGLGFQISWIVYDAVRLSCKHFGEVDGFIISGAGSLSTITRSG